MDIGMLWYDDDSKRQLDEKVARAAEFYRAKYGVQPTECYVHPGLLAVDQPTVTAGGVRVRGNRTVIKNHLWLGVGEAAPAAASAKPAVQTKQAPVVEQAAAAV
ncbi:MAG: hypothetical protein ABI847_03805, partial [Anaerolineales bacterium]